MNALKHKYGDRLEIIATPCNQFGLQEPGDNPEILNGLKFVRPGGGYVPSFPVFAKIDVNGASEHPLYTHLKSSCPPVKLEIGNSSKLYWPIIKVGDVTWNFEKFLVDAEGIPYKRFDPSVSPENLVPAIEALLTRHDERNRMRNAVFEYINPGESLDF